MSDDERLTKIVIDLPNHWATGGEGIWALPLGNDLFEIRNVPFYAYDLNHLDVVRAVSPSPQLKPQVQEVVRRSGHQTLRVFVNEATAERAPELLRRLSPMGASFERATRRFFALDIEPGGSYDAVRAQLDAWESDGVLQYETCEARQTGSFDDLPRSGSSKGPS